LQQHQNHSQTYTATFRWEATKKTLIIILTNTSSRIVRQKNLSTHLTHVSVGAPVSNIPRTITGQHHGNNGDNIRGDDIDSIARTTTLKASTSVTKTNPTSTFMDIQSPVNTHQASYRTYYTFIIHKCNLPTIPAPSKSRTPTFAAFNHGDHYHFLFGVAHTNNCTRNFHNILQFLRLPYPGTAEANTTLQPIRFIQRFLDYLIRIGLSTFFKYGLRQIPLLSNITKLLQGTTDTSSFEPCETYIEGKKATTEHFIKQRTFSTNYINHLITKYNTQSFEDFLLFPPI
jgi:hypothetical protein